MSGSYAKNPHDAPDDFSEMREKLERCEAEAGRWYADATKVQKAVYDRAMNDLRPYRGSPRWDRGCIKAGQVYSDTTEGARKIYRMAFNDLMLLGEISEATSYAFDALMVAGPQPAIISEQDQRDIAYADFQRALRMERSSRMAVRA